LVALLFWPKLLLSQEAEMREKFSQFGQIEEEFFVSSVDGQIRPFVYFRPEGPAIHSLLVWLPAGYSEPGARWRWGESFFPVLPQIQGVAILFFEPRQMGSGFGHTFYIDTPFSPTGETDVLDAIARVEALLGVQLDRFLAGGSHGAIGALGVALRNPDLFKGAYAIAPAIDLEAQYFHLESLVAQGREWPIPLLADLREIFGGPPMTTNAHHWQEANIEWLARNLPQTGRPLYLAWSHGHQDDNMPYAQNLQRFMAIYEELEKQGSDIVFLPFDINGVDFEGQIVGGGHADGQVFSPSAVIFFPRAIEKIERLITPERRWLTRSRSYVTP